MSSTVEPLEGNKIKLSVTVDEQDFDREVDAAFKRIAKEVRIPGFRPGKAPRKILEARIGTEVAREEALREGLPKFYVDAVREHEVDVIAPPEIDITDGRDTGPVTFDAVVEVRPVVTLDGYDSLKVTLDRPEPSDDEIDAQIDRMRQLDSTLETVDRPVIEGDQVTIDIQGTIDGESQDGLTADDYLYEVGKASIVAELDEELTGAKVGDILEFGATHPDPDEEGELRFRVLVKEVKKTVLPDATDEWAAEASDFETVEELRADLRRRMATVRRAQAQMNLRERVGESLAALVDQDVPDALVEVEMQNRIQELAMRLQAQGMSIEQYLSMTGSTQEDFVEGLRETAGLSARVDLALRAVVASEGLTCSDDDLDDELAAVADRIGEKVQKVRTQFERNDQIAAVRSDIEKRKALDWLLEHVEIVDPDGETIDRADLEIVDDTSREAQSSDTEDAGTDQPESSDE